VYGRDAVNGRRYEAANAIGANRSASLRVAEVLDRFGQAIKRRLDLVGGRGFGRAETARRVAGFEDHCNTRAPIQINAITVRPTAARPKHKPSTS
jgi:hypothetical protein